MLCLKSVTFALALTAIFLPLTARANISTVKKIIIDLLAKESLQGGVIIKDLSSERLIAINENRMFPMASVYKFPIALAVLRKVDKNELNLTRIVTITKNDIVGGIRGPIARLFKGHELNLTVLDLLKYMVSDSDNTACDQLIKLSGGPKKITSYLREWGIVDINVSRSESQILIEGSEPGPTALDATSPTSMTLLYEKFIKNEILSEISTNQLIDLMLNSKTPPHIKKGISNDYAVANKSGWCGEICVNDSAVVIHKISKKKYIIAVFLYGKSDYQRASNLIARIAKLGMDTLVAEE
jgi:beta-lactamase class A